MRTVIIGNREIIIKFFIHLTEFQKKKQIYPNEVYNKILFF
jgi:hypothetical protein